MMEKAEKNKNPKHNRLRIVYDINKNGEVLSYIHVEHSEAKKIIAILKFVNQCSDWVPLDKIEKATKIKRGTLGRLIRVMAGALWADMKKEGIYQKLVPGTLIHMKKSMMNKKRNHPKAPPYLKAPYYIRRACL